MDVSDPESKRLSSDQQLSSVLSPHRLPQELQLLLLLLLADLHQLRAEGYPIHVLLVSQLLKFEQLPNDLSDGFGVLRQKVSGGLC